MTQERKTPGQGGDFPTSSQVPGALNPEPVREPWDPKREPHGGGMPWEQQDKDKDQSPRPGMGGDTGTAMGNQEGQGPDANQGPNQNRSQNPGQGPGHVPGQGQNQKR